ncbi:MULTISPECIES: hypothetical protein [Pseudomonas syringae group]|uniref:hypothetical protein n=1 Tax=Pseudomonas syringae group TaxID=136849 RepID=UPI000E311C38|nr:MULTISPECIES: hypothetical protein [Pseudomonas syringae group]
MNEELNAQLASAAVGHLAVIKIGLGLAGDVEACVVRMTVLAELKKRGVRFLPAQAIKRVLRKHKTA